MMHSPYPVMLDACVLYPARLRDLLMHLGLRGLYQPKWTATIQQEWKRGLLRERKDIEPSKLDRIEQLMNQALPDAEITGYEALIAGLDLPDPDDRHVLAAAIKANAELIVTFNLQDFPAGYLSQFGIEAIHPDEFVSDIIDLSCARALQAVSAQRASLKHPPFTAEAFLSALLQLGLAKTVRMLEGYKTLI
ncbi:PIN domain-containing protein [Nissabacter sp. SGAir0207]|uniref:PIN domain-containing protein n=1 Tax=Nissabacter sp. SGAir0207 TaxID=2126321 RepID=UPI0010CD0F83|nr:PIN domain-containing protein [Nissabacter sp. SGAir0207]QCR35328.1 PIN domain-containing protein [Nissabacter sp. SGAir0207]